MECGIMRWPGHIALVHDMPDCWEKVVGKQSASSPTTGCTINDDPRILFRTFGHEQRNRTSPIIHYAYFTFRGNQYYFRVVDGPLPDNTALTFKPH